MMKKSIFCLAMLLIGCSSLLKAQEPVLHFYDDFESGTITHWTTIDADDDGWCWEIISQTIQGFIMTETHSPLMSFTAL